MKNKGAKPQQVMLKGIIDTVADATIISLAYWPKTWQTTTAITGIAGIGGMSFSKQSTDIVQIIGPEGETANIRPFVVDVPLNLWGRDVLGTWGVTISTGENQRHF